MAVNLAIITISPENRENITIYNPARSIVLMESKAVGFDLAELALDADAAKILALTYTNPRGVRELCDVLKIPQVKCYRRIKDLEKLGLLKGIGSNKRNRTYSSNMERMSLIINDSRMVLTTEFKDGGKSSFDLKLNSDTGSTSTNHQSSQ